MLEAQVDEEEQQEKRRKFYRASRLLNNVLHLGLGQTHLVMDGYEKLSKRQKFKNDDKIQQVLFETQDVFVHDTRSYTHPTNEFINDFSVRQIS